MTLYTLPITPEMLENARILARTALAADSYEDFKTTLLQLNAVVRGYDANTFVDYRDKNEKVSGHHGVMWIAPTPDVIDDLMKTAWHKSFEFLTGAQRAAYLYHAIYTAHPFKNGNGRVGRALFFEEHPMGDYKETIWHQPDPYYAARTQGNEIDYSAFAPPISEFVGFTHELLQANLHDRLALTIDGDVKRLILTGCNFNNPWYWRDVEWAVGISPDYKTLLQETFTSKLRFPDVVLLETTLELGIATPRDIKIDPEKNLVVNIHPEKMLGLKTHGELVKQRLREEKNKFALDFIQDNNKHIANILKLKLPAPAEGFPTLTLQ